MADHTSLNRVARTTVKRRVGRIGARRRAQRTMAHIAFVVGHNHAPWVHDTSADQNVLESMLHDHIGNNRRRDLLPSANVEFVFNDLTITCLLYTSRCV